MSPAGLNALKRSCCPVRKSIALCERKSNSLLPDVMISLSKHVCMCINMIQAYTSKQVMESQVGMLVSPGGSVEVEIMASTSRASRKK
jgi:hypothetical protein